jgi:diguanylate cyclase (GGDEF)-like protein
VGDAVLREISQELQRIFRSSDYLARWGGEEFLIALTHTGMQDAREVLERLRGDIADLRSLSVPAVTISMGAAAWHPDSDLHTVLKQADLALYQAKAGGRNQLVAATELDGAPEQGVLAGSLGATTP